ncbi:MAG: PQQ-binding-like beta-propeller repeat protein [Phycisphaeraceae bacterium]
MKNARLCCALAALLLLTCGVASADWPQWRGPDRMGTLADTRWPQTLNDKNIQPLWRIELSPGYPGPIVSGNRVFTVETENAKDEVVRTFDTTTREELWTQRWPGSMKVPFFARKNGSWIKSTPATDGQRLYVMGMLDELVCLQAASGEVVWRVDFKERFGTRSPQFGQACSPLIDGDAVYVQAGLSVCKLNKLTGETIWRVLHDQRDFIGGNFSSPVIATVAGKRQLLAQTRGALCGIDLETGEVLWQKAIKAFRGMNILPPTAVGADRVFTSSYGGGSFMFKIAANDNGDFDAELVWSHEKSEGYMSSPQLVDGHLYFHGRYQTWWCLDVETGEVNWSVKDEAFGDYSSSVVSGNRILSLGYDGTLRLMNATPKKMDIVSEHKVSDQETWGHLAVVDDTLYIRELKGLKAIRWAEPAGLD